MNEIPLGVRPVYPTNPCQSHFSLRKRSVGAGLRIKPLKAKVLNLVYGNKYGNKTVESSR